MLSFFRKKENLYLEYINGTWTLFKLNFQEEDLFNLPPKWKPKLPDFSPELFENKDDLCPCPEPYLEVSAGYFKLDLNHVPHVCEGHYNILAELCQTLTSYLSVRLTICLCLALAVQTMPAFQLFIRMKNVLSFLFLYKILNSYTRWSKVFIRLSRQTYFAFSAVSTQYDLHLKGYSES